MEASGQIHNLATLSPTPTPKKAPWYPLTRIGGTQTQPGHFGEVKNPLSLPRVEPEIIHPTAHHYT